MTFDLPCHLCNAGPRVPCPAAPDYPTECPHKWEPVDPKTNEIVAAEFGGIRRALASHSEHHASTSNEENTRGMSPGEIIRWYARLFDGYLRARIETLTRPRT